jgi:signal transduction histidine kinase
MLADAPMVAGLLALTRLFGGDWFRLPGAGGHAGGIAISVLLAGPVLARRRHPPAAFAIAVTTAAVVAALGSASQGAGAMAIPAIMVLLYTLAAHHPRRISLRGLYLCLAVIVVAAIRLPPEPGHLDVISRSIRVVLEGGAPTVSTWLLGDSVAYRRAHNAWLEERARRAEAERDARAQLAAAAERSRIAREMHDIIAHNLSVIVGLADGGLYAAARSPERSSQALGAIATTGREALSELRRLLGVLTEGNNRAADLAPQPGLTDLEALLDRVRAAGLPVRCTAHGDPRRLSEGRQLTVYRIVQEALTNTLKHAGPAATAEVTLDYAGGAVDVHVTDTGHGTATGSRDGRGLHGMRERATMYEGTLHAGPGPSGGWRVEAHLPAPEATAAAS